MTTLRCALPITPRQRVSGESAWPLRTADGQTFAERHARRNEQEKRK